MIVPTLIDVLQINFNNIIFESPYTQIRKVLKYNQHIKRIMGRVGKKDACFQAIYDFTRMPTHTQIKTSLDQVSRFFLIL